MVSIFPDDQCQSASPRQLQLLPNDKNRYTVLFETLGEMAFLLVSGSRVFGGARAGNRGNLSGVLRQWNTYCFQGSSSPEALQSLLQLGCTYCDIDTHVIDTDFNKQRDSI